MNPIQFIATAAIPILFAITIHEMAHGWLASKLGDKTALMLGRVTLNPVKHIDLIGTIIVPLSVYFLSNGNFIFGWAKPVPVNWQNLNHPRRDAALVALAGPVSNLIMALIWAIIAKISMIFFSGNNDNFVLNNIATFIHYASLYGIMINIVLMILNLLPLPPLDGSRVVSSVLPPRISKLYERIEPFGIWIFLILLISGIMQYILLPPIRWFIIIIKNLFNLNLNL